MNDGIRDAQTADDAQSEDAYSAPFALNISFPESITIKMVDASALNDYEILLLFTGLFCNVCCGFGVAAVTTVDKSNITFTVAIIFATITIGAFSWAMMKRAKMAKRSKAFKIKTSSVTEAN